MVTRLQEALAEEQEVHGKVMAELELPIQATPPAEEDEDHGYVARVNHLQQQITEKYEAIAKVAKERKGRVPLSVCHQLEQCIREVEVCL